VLVVRVQLQIAQTGLMAVPRYWAFMKLMGVQVGMGLTLPLQEAQEPVGAVALLVRVTHPRLQV